MMNEKKDEFEVEGLMKEAVFSEILLSFVRNAYLVDCLILRFFLIGKLSYYF